MSQSFLEKLRDYLNERLRNEVLYGLPFKPFEIRGRTVRAESLTPGGLIEEHTDGTIVVESERVDCAGDYIGECLVKSYRRRFGKAKAKGKEEEEKVWKALRKEDKEACEDYTNRRNFEKHLKKSYKEAFIRLLWFDEVCRRISDEYEVEVKVEVDGIDYDSFLVSEFNGSNTSEDEKLEQIKKRVEAVIAAYKLTKYAYISRWPSEREKENHKKYLEFRKAILEKYTSKDAIKNHTGEAIAEELDTSALFTRSELDDVHSWEVKDFTCGEV